MEKTESKELCWEAGSLLPVKLFWQDIECLIAFLKAEGQKIEPWKKKEANWKAQLQKLLAENQNPALTETQEEVLLEQGLDLITELLMTLSSCYEKQ